LILLVSTIDRFMLERFGQGNAVDRSRPHVFHRDYWSHHYLLVETKAFAEKFRAELEGKRVLDFGADKSPYDRLFQQAGVELVKADIDPPPGRGILAIGPDGRVPVGDGEMSAVISTQVLEHVPEVGRYLAEARRVLAVGGLLFLSTHGAYILHRHPTDLRRWTIDGLRYDVEQAGFEVEAVTPRIGIWAMSTHLRSILYGGLTRRVPGTGWLRPLIYLLFNTRMWLEDALTPASVMESHPELLFLVARKK
jgi:SAM-dependent methyltransferase